MSLKRGKLSVVELTYIEAKHNELTIEQIASDLNRSVASVKKMVGKSRCPDTDIPLKEESTHPEKTATLKMMVGDGDKGVAIMTGSASERGDESRSKRIGVNSRYVSCTRKIYKK